MEFFTAYKEPRPVRLPEMTRTFAYESLHYKYGRDTWENQAVSLDHIPNFDQLSTLEKYNAAIFEIASNAPIRVCENELISGAATLGAAIKHMVPATYNGKLLFDSVSHLTLGFDNVLKFGVNDIKKRINKSLSNQTNKKNIETLKSMLHCINCLEIWHGRYIEALSRSKKYAGNLKNLQNVPFQPATSFYEAVQSLWFTFAFTRLCGNWPGIGRIDAMLGPYLKKDLAQGIITIQQAREVLAHFFIKGCEWVRGGDYEGGDAQHYQNIILSGVDENGEDITNEVTYLVLDIIEELGISDFPITVRVNKNTEITLLKRMAEVIRHGGGIVAVYNEDLILDALTDFGYDLKEARTFANDGCWEMQIPGKTCFSYAPFDALKLLQDATLAGYDKNKTCFDTYEGLYQKFLEDLKEAVENIYKECSYDSEYWNLRAETPCSVVSLFTEECIERGLSYFDGGAKYYVISPHIGGLPDVVNSLYAIRRLVFEEKKVTFPGFMDILKNNWEGYEPLRQYVLNHYEYFGNDNDEVDRIAVQLLDDFSDICQSLNGRSIILYPAGVSTFGRQIQWAPERMASPHGRKKGDVLAGNLSPTPGTDLKGATAVIKSYCKANMKKLVSGAALDINLFPTTVYDNEGIEAIIGLIQGFVKLGGFFMQLDVVDNNILKQAQVHPENFPTLSVRVSGWNARFVTLNKEWQDMIIQRVSKENA
ncbi:MAG: hypothetical protein GX754_10375 [Clostridiaceae bacterium]|nr:hypothetical protein [Clostridiaceae bacterium]